MAATATQPISSAQLHDEYASIVDEHDAVLSAFGEMTFGELDELASLTPLEDDGGDDGGADDTGNDGDDFDAAAFDEMIAEATRIESTLF